MRAIFLGAAFLAAGLACTSARRPPKPESSLMKSIRMELQDPPLLGTTSEGQAIRLGGFSGLRYLHRSEDGKYHFLTLTDRGPNAEEMEEKSGEARPFAWPEYQPQIVFLEADPARGTLRVERRLPLRRPDGKQLTGLPQRKGLERPIDLRGRALPYDARGVDPEGIVPLGNGDFWVAEEYGPSLLRFSPEGVLQEILKPGSGLPQVLANTQLNRGFEGLAAHGNRLYAVVQSPLAIGKKRGARKSLLVRVIEVDLRERVTAAQYAYTLTNEGSDRIGDLTWESPESLLLIEQDGKAGAGAQKRVVRVRLRGATNLQLLPERLAGVSGELESLDLAGLAANGVHPLAKEEVFDLASAGVLEGKAEGLALVDGQFLAVIVDNDFGLAGGWGDGKFTESGVRSALYLLPLR
jgi:3-phytase